MLAAVDVQTGVLARFFRRISHQRRLASTFKTSHRVRARGFRTADVRCLLTLVDVDADRAGRLEPGPAPAGPVFPALRVVGAVEVGLAAGPDFGREAARFSVSLVTGRTLADISGNPVDAFGADSALMKGSGSTFVDIYNK